MSLLFDLLSTSAIFVLVALGLWFVFGLLDIINLALAGFMAVGAYSEVASRSLWIGLIIAVVASAAVGYLLERVVVRRLYRRPLDAIVATWGASLVLVQALSLIFTPSIQKLTGPLSTTYWLQYPAYRFVLVFVAAGLLAAVGATLYFTRAGLTIRAVMENESLAASMGINTTQVRTSTFVVGAALSGAVGALIAPTQTVSPDFGSPFLIVAILVVLLSGRSVWGLIISCILVGAVTSLFSRFSPVPSYSTVAVVVVGVIALRLFQGGFAWKRRRA